jgi:hypothetical protein
MDTTDLDPLAHHGDVVVDASTDAGGFYCEHCFYVAHVVARPDTVVGFLHVPPQRSDATQQRRHRHTRLVVAAALRGLLNELAGDVDVLLTGFEPWGEVTRNPSGDFVGHVGNLDAAMSVVGAPGRGRLRRTNDDGWTARDYRVDGRRVSLWPHVLPVDDGAIDGGHRSVQAGIAACRPHVVLSLGVHRRTDRHRVEHIASDRHLRRSASGFAHDVSAPAGHTLPANDALARAIVSGWRWATASSSSWSAP